MDGEMATRENVVREKLEGFIVENFLFGDETRKPAPVASLIGTGTLDSTGILELIQFLEATFGIAVDETETTPDNLDSIDALVDFVGRKSNGSSASLEARE